MAKVPALLFLNVFSPGSTAPEYAAVPLNAKRIELIHDRIEMLDALRLENRALSVMQWDDPGGVNFHYFPEDLYEEGAAGEGAAEREGLYRAIRAVNSGNSFVLWDADPGEISDAYEMDYLRLQIRAGGHIGWVGQTRTYLDAVEVEWFSLDWLAEIYDKITAEQRGEKRVQSLARLCRMDERVAAKRLSEVGDHSPEAITIEMLSRMMSSRDAEVREKAISAMGRARVAPKDISPSFSPSSLSLSLPPSLPMAHYLKPVHLPDSGPGSIDHETFVRPPLSYETN